VEIVRAKIIWFYDSALRSSAQTRGDRPCRYMNLASPPWVMNSRYISEEYHIYTIERILSILYISFHGVTLHCISLHLSFLFEYVFYWCWTLRDFDYPYLMENWLKSIRWTCKIKELFSYILMSLLLHCWSMRYIWYMWFCTHTTLVALFCGAYCIRIWAHFLELEFEFG